MADVWFPPKRPDPTWGLDRNSVPTHKAKLSTAFWFKKCVDVFLRLDLSSGLEAFFVHDSERIRFCVELLFEPREAHKFHGHSLSAVRDYLLSLFAGTVHIAGRSSIRNLRTCLVVLTGTHLSRRKWEDNIKMDLLEV